MTAENGPPPGVLTPSAPAEVAALVRQMDVARRFVATLAPAQGGKPRDASTVDEWDELWASADGEENVERAIAKVALQASRLAADRLPLLEQADERPPAVVNGSSPARRPTPAGRAIDAGTAQAAQVAGARRHQRMVTASTWVRNIGALMILFAAWQLWGTAIAQHHVQSSLRQQFDAKVHHTAKPVAATAPLVPKTVKVPDAPEGTVDARLQIPAIGVDEYVVAGTATDDLSKGPGHYTGTAMPGQAGNVAIAGHRTTHGAPFNRLGDLVVGDHLFLTSSSGRQLTYVVAQTPYPVAPSNVSVLNDFGDDRLTLTTCNPEYSATQRLIVVAEYQPAGSVPAASPGVTLGAGTPYHVQSAGEGGWNLGSMPWVLLELTLLIGLGLANHRLSRLYGRARWLILVPVWAALIYLLFQTLTTVLPAAV